jgi:hypothetical protein
MQIIAFIHIWHTRSIIDKLLLLRQPSVAWCVYGQLTTHDCYYLCSRHNSTHSIMKMCVCRMMNGEIRILLHLQGSLMPENELPFSHFVMHTHDDDDSGKK